MLSRFPRCHLPDRAPVSRLPTDGDQQLPWQQHPPPARHCHQMLPAKQRLPRRRSSPSPEEDESWLPRGNFPALIISPQAALPKPLPHSAGTGLDLERQPDSSCFFFHRVLPKLVLGSVGLFCPRAPSWERCHPKADFSPAAPCEHSASVRRESLRISRRCVFISLRTGIKATKKN